MAEVGFFTAVSFNGHEESPSDSLLEIVDSYFYLGGKKAYVIPRAEELERAVLFDDSPEFLPTVLKIVSYLTLVLPLVMLVAKAALRSLHSFYIVDARAELEQGIEVSEETIRNIEGLFNKIRRDEDDPAIHWYARGNNHVFGLVELPNLVFKMAPLGRIIYREGRQLGSEDLAHERFTNMIKAKEICLIDELDLLIVPHAKKIRVWEGNRFVTLLAEERLEIRANESAQEYLYQTLPGLNETIGQLATFITKTGFSDVVWRNMPILDDAHDFQGRRRVALIDLEEMENPADGIFGGAFGRRGLVRCLASEEQIDVALAVAAREGVVDRFVSPQRIKAERLQELTTDRELEQFYNENGITENPRKPIPMVYASLGVDLDEQGVISVPTEAHQEADGGVKVVWEEKPVTLRRAAVEVISRINKAITETPDDASTKGKRNILLKSNDGNLQSYERIGFLRKIIDALVAKKHVFKLNDYNGHGYYIQA